MYGDFFLHHTRTRCLQFQIFAHLSSEDIWIFLFPSNCHTQKAENSPQGNFFSTCIIFDICDKYQVWCECWFGLMLSFGIQPRMSKKQNHWISENKSEPQMSETPNVRNPERPKPWTSETPNVPNTERPNPQRPKPRSSETPIIRNLNRQPRSLGTMNVSNPECQSGRWR